MRTPCPSLGASAAPLLLAVCCAAQAEQSVAAPKPAGATANWPAELLLTGTLEGRNLVPMGTTAKRALELAKLFYPHNDQLALVLLKNISSELGESEVEVPAFYLGKHPVTNEQYLHFVKATGARFPFHWWKEGEAAHFDKTRPKCAKLFPQDKGQAPLKYWEMYWKKEPADDEPAGEAAHSSQKVEGGNGEAEKPGDASGDGKPAEGSGDGKSPKDDGGKPADGPAAAPKKVESKGLPYSIPKGTEKHPVTFVSLSDAQQYAAWAGMRLPTEAEWTLAANGGKRREFVFGDEWSEAILENLLKVKARELQAVGGLGALAQGPFGHADLVGQVWEWVMPIGYLPQNDEKLFNKEHEELRRSKEFGSRLEMPEFKPEKALLKGGSYFTFTTQDYLQVRINCRGHALTEATAEGIGFRVAKSKRPAYDMSISRLKLEYPSYLPGNREPALARQVGIERYELIDEGRIVKNYDAISFVPIDCLSDHKNPRVAQLADDSRESPTPLGVLITTVALAEPALEPGVYTIYLREAGITKDLQDALKQGHRVLVAEAKAKAKGGGKDGEGEKEKDKDKEVPPEPEDGKEDGEGGKPDPKRKWRAELKKYFFTEDEVRDTKLSELEKYVWVRHAGGDGKTDDRFKVSTKENLLLLRDRDGRWLAGVPTKLRFKDYKTVSADAASELLKLEKGGYEVSFSVAIDEREKEKRGVSARRREAPFTFVFQPKSEWK